MLHKLKEIIVYTKITGFFVHFYKLVAFNVHVNVFRNFK